MALEESTFVAKEPTIMTSHQALQLELSILTHVLIFLQEQIDIIWLLSY
jgi:hypothetical protein